MVSEDSDQLRSVLLPVHRLGDLRDLHQTRAGQVTSVIDHPDDLRELLEVRSLRRPERVPLEERDDRPEQIRTSPNDEAVHGLAVVVVSPVDDDVPNPEEVAEPLKAIQTGPPLRNRELVSHLPAGSVAAPAASARLADEADREASFSVYETKDPSQRDQPFLLVFRPGQIVTAPHDK